MIPINEKIKTLLVDDDRVARVVLSEKIRIRGHEIVIAEDGDRALEEVQKSPDIDLIILDREMPVMNGMEVVSILKENKKFSKIPIVMVTSSSKPEQIKEGIDAGVFYYLTKPFDENIFLSVIKAAERDVLQRRILKEELGKHKGSFQLINLCEFSLRTISEADSLAVFLSNCYPDPQRVVSGIVELLINSIEHGNLAISYDEKTDLIKNNDWINEINKRLSLSEYADLQVKVTFRKNDDGLYLKIKDAGKGFDWKKYLEIDPARASDNHGRGIAQAKVSFDELRYNNSGNEVVTIARESENLEW